MLQYSFSASTILGPMVMVLPRRNPCFGGSPRADPGIGQTVDQTINRATDQRSESQHDPHNELHRSNGPVVTGHGKLCFWCVHEGVTYEPQDIQGLQNKVYHDSGYEGHSQDNQHNDPQDDPVMREYAKGPEQFTRGLHGEVPYSDEELPGSGNEASEAYLMTPHRNILKMRPFCDPHMPSP